MEISTLKIEQVNITFKKLTIKNTLKLEHISVKTQTISEPGKGANSAY